MCLKCVRLLLDKDDGREWDEQRFDWSLKPSEHVVYTYYYMDNETKTIEYCFERPASTKCICGHDIIENYYVYNANRGVCFLLGGICIINHKKNNGAFNEVSLIKNQIDLLNRTFCSACNINVKTNSLVRHNKGVRHKANEIKKIKKDYRKCRHCGELTIHRSMPYYFYCCSACYASQKRK